MSMKSLFKNLKSFKIIINHCFAGIDDLLLHLQRFLYREFSLTWPTSMQIYWNKRKHLYIRNSNPAGFCLGNQLTWQNSRRFVTPLLVPRTTSKRRLRNDLRNSILMTRHYSNLGSASDRLKQISHAAWPIRMHYPCQIWVVTRHQYGISALVSQTSFRGGEEDQSWRHQTSFRGETSGDVAKCRLFFQAKHQHVRPPLPCFVKPIWPPLRHV